MNEGRLRGWYGHGSHWNRLSWAKYSWITWLVWSHDRFLPMCNPRVWPFPTWHPCWKKSIKKIYIGKFNCIKYASLTNFRTGFCPWGVPGCCVNNSSSGEQHIGSLKTNAHMQRLVSNFHKLFRIISLARFLYPPKPTDRQQYSRQYCSYLVLWIGALLNWRSRWIYLHCSISGTQIEISYCVYYCHD